MEHGRHLTAITQLLPLQALSTALPNHTNGAGRCGEVTLSPFPRLAPPKLYLRELPSLLLEVS